MIEKATFSLFFRVFSLLLATTTADKMKKRTREAEEKEQSSPDDAVVIEIRASKRVKKTTETFTIDGSVKKKELTIGNGTCLKDIPAIAKAIKTYPATRYHYYLESLHNLMYGFAGTNKNRRQSILQFSGYPPDTNREGKLKILNGPKFIHTKCSMIRTFLEIFQLDTKGGKAELINRLLDFLFHPQPE